MKIIGSETTQGYLFALLAFGIWALFPIYWHMLDHVDAIEILAHRILWTLPVCAFVLLLMKDTKSVLIPFKRPKLLFLLAISTTLIATNWGVYIWSVTHDKIMQASLGYFLNPLVSVVAGLLLFKERLRKGQWLAVGLAITGVLVAAFSAGEPPWIGLILAFSFGIYGAIRKIIPVESVPGLLIETLLIAPIALGYLIWLEINGLGSFSHLTITTDVVLAGTGLMTAIPLLSYVAAARRLPISTVGMMFYITPTGLFLMAAFLYGEPITNADLITFGFIWAGLAIFTVERHHNARKNREIAI